MRHDTEHLDRFNQLVWDADLAVGILANPATSDVELVDLTSGPFPDGLRATIAKRGLYFIGTAGLIQGVPRTALAEPLSARAIAKLTESFIRHVEAAANASLERSYLQRLGSLPDPRPA